MFCQVPDEAQLFEFDPFGKLVALACVQLIALQVKSGATVVLVVVVGSATQLHSQLDVPTSLSAHICPSRKCPDT